MLPQCSNKVEQLPATAAAGSSASYDSLAGVVAKDVHVGGVAAARQPGLHRVAEAIDASGCRTASNRHGERRCAPLAAIMQL